MADPVDLLTPDEVSQLMTRHTEVLQQIATGAPLSRLLDGITTALERLIDGSRCSILLLARDGVTLRHGAAPSLPAAYSEQIDGLRIGPLAGSCGTAVHEGRRVIVEDIAVDPRWADFRGAAMPHGLRSCWSTPILGPSGQATGTFAVYHDDPHTPDPRELQLVDRFTHLSAVAIEHMALYGALADSEEQFRRAFEDNAVGMALIDLDGVLARTNTALEILVTGSRGGLVERPFVDVLDAESLERWTRAWGGLAAGTVESTSLRVVLADDRGARPTVLATMSLVRDHDDQPRFVSLNALDMTERIASQADRRARREAEIARRTAEAASQAKSEFLTTLSHEMRTPLQAITGFAELLGTLDLDDVRRREAVDHVQGATSHLLAMVEDVLDISRIEAGNLPLATDEVRLGPLARDVVDLLRPLAARRCITLVADETSLDVSVRADARRLRQVLINLVTNAVRYGAEGGSATVRRQPGEPGGPGEPGPVTVVVHDDGLGIPADLMDRVFVPFDTLGATSPPDDPGVGIGLIVTRGLCESMGGSFELTSTPGQGTTARLTLPRHVAS